MIDYGVFDSQSLSLMRVALDEALEALPSDRRTLEMRERIARAVVNLAAHWARDPTDLGAVSTAERASISCGVD